MKHVMCKQLIWLLILLVATAGRGQVAAAKSDQAREKVHQVKAAFLYNILKFVAWPEGSLEKKDDRDEDGKHQLVIGCFDTDEQAEFLQYLKGKEIGPITLHLKMLSARVAENKSAEVLRNDPSLSECHVLYFGNLKQAVVEKVLNAVAGRSVLTAGQRKGFPEGGGMLNIVQDNNKLGFEINLIQTKKAKLEIRSKLIRLARRVIEEEK